MRRVDVAAFNVGLVGVELAVLALCAAFGTLDWKLTSIVAPLGLVVIGLAGLLLSRNSTKGNR
ncbi:MAG: hypothetical protein QM619_03095 [Micropruina sp.]|uniref:hypothetical protein n=1 Tax=Micropruina sp. TaxID=2737536 RepID=UPI0039E64489